MGREAARIIFERLTGKPKKREIIDVGFDIAWRGTA
jgi:DNA-binding LacI/PurR family transcriptional regulator